MAGCEPVPVSVLPKRRTGHLRLALLQHKFVIPSSTLSHAGWKRQFERSSLSFCRQFLYEAAGIAHDRPFKTSARLRGFRQLLEFHFVVLREG